MTEAYFSTFEVLFFLTFLKLKIEKNKKIEFSFYEGEFYDWSNRSISIDGILEYLEKEDILTFNMFGEDDWEMHFFGDIKLEKFDSFFKLTLEKLKDEFKAIEEEKNNIIGFNPNEIDNKIKKAKKQIEIIEKQSKDNEILNGLKKDIQSLNSYLISIETINNDYTNIFNNIMNPIKKESEKGLKATFRTAIWSIIISTIISIIIQNWNFIYPKIF